MTIGIYERRHFRKIDARLVVIEDDHRHATARCHRQRIMGGCAAIHCNKKPPAPIIKAVDPYSAWTIPLTHAIGDMDERINAAGAKIP